jgi:hypothetical protein
MKSLQAQKENLLKLLEDNNEDYVEKIANLDAKHANLGLQGMVLRFRNNQMTGIIAEL